MGDQIIFQKDIPASLLPVKAKFRYRGADILVEWTASDTSGLLLNNQTVPALGTSYELRIKAGLNETFQINIGVQSR